MTAQRRVFSPSNRPYMPNGRGGSRFVHRRVKLKSRCVEFTIEDIDSGHKARTCIDPVQWQDSLQLSYDSSVWALFPNQRIQEEAHSSLPSPPPSCAWKLPEMKGVYRGLMRPFVCVCFPCEFIPKLEHVNAQDELRGLPASSGSSG